MGARSGDSSERGTRPLGLGTGRDGLLHVPLYLEPDVASPLVIMLHGAGAWAGDVMPMVAAAADRQTVLVLAPDARGATWDVIQRDYGPDVAFLDHALERLFETYAVDPDRIAIAGFSDGASYALSLGLVNGTCSATSWRSHPGSQPRAGPRITHGSSSPTAARTRSCHLSAAATAWRRHSRSRTTMSTTGLSMAGTSCRRRWSRLPSHES